MDEAENKPTDPTNWTRVYIIVLAVLVLEIILFTLITFYYK